ncbi:MAG TPA: DUF2178 domain-containing protein [Methanoregulaceae archaeon]|nr:DUF2178 domain-containing protein [Methanoregulaceae archaeon]HQJ88326.1 DUF2178 domain-containing protein [Methanoregulaceae archaeon]
MRRNTFYLLIGVTALILVGILYLAILLSWPALIQGAFLVAFLALYALKRTVDEPVEDERTNVITQHAAVATLGIFWVIFFLVSLGQVVISFSTPLGFHAPPPPGMAPLPPTQDFLHVGRLGIVQLGLLGLMIILYGGFRIYYAQRFGDWESDEE